MALGPQRGRLFLVKVDDGSGTFVKIGGQRTTRAVINNDMVDVSNKDTSAWRKLGSDLGLRHMQLTLQCIFQDDAAHEVVRAAAFGGVVLPFQLIADNGDIYQGHFLPQNFEHSGNYNNAEEYSFT